MSSYSLIATGIAHKTAHPMSLAQKFGQRAGTKIAKSAGEQNVHQQYGVLSLCLRLLYLEKTPFLLSDSKSIFV
jgi:hypothetical protein